MPIRKRIYKRRPKAKSCKKALTKTQRSCVRKMIEGSPEPKYYNVTSTSLTTLAETTVDLSGISQGDGVVNRDGDMLDPTSLILRYRIVRDSGASTSSPDNVRVMVIQWHPDSAIDSPVFADLLQNPSAAYVALSPLILNKNHRGMFTLLYDKVHFNLCDRSLGKEAHAQVETVLYPKRKLKFNTGATSGRNKIFMLVMGQQGSGTEDCVMCYDATLRFKDL